MLLDYFHHLLWIAGGPWWCIPQVRFPYLLPRLAHSRCSININIHARRPVKCLALSLKFESDLSLTNVSLKFCRRLTHPTLAFHTSYFLPAHSFILPSLPPFILPSNIFIKNVPFLNLSLWLLRWIMLSLPRNPRDQWGRSQGRKSEHRCEVGQQSTFPHLCHGAGLSHHTVQLLLSDFWRSSYQQRYY